jgi:hypothetical protein
MRAHTAYHRRHIPETCPRDIFKVVRAKPFSIMEPIRKELERSEYGTWVARSLGRDPERFTHARVGLAHVFADRFDQWLDETAQSGILPRSLDVCRRTDRPCYGPLKRLAHDFLSAYPLAPTLSYCHDYTHVREQYVANRKWGSVSPVGCLPVDIRRVAPDCPLSFDVDGRRRCGIDLRVLTWRTATGMSRERMEFVRSIDCKVEHRPDGSQAGVVFTQRVCIGHAHDPEHRLLIEKTIPPVASELAVTTSAPQSSHRSLSRFVPNQTTFPTLLNAPVLRLLRLFEAVPNPGPFDVVSDELAFLFDRDSGELLSITTESRLLWPYEASGVTNTRWFNWLLRQQ